LIGREEAITPPRDYRSASRYVDDALWDAIWQGLYARGILPDPDYEEPWFLCYALGEADVDETLQAFEDAVSDAVRA